MALTPMMQQYLKVKEQYKDTILFYRLGDFYEMFFEDALIASKELELVLTGRDCGLDERAPMCGIPYHASKNYIGRLVEKGYKVAIVEQMEDPALAKGIVKRDVIKIITPGTLNDETFLNENKNSYIMSLIDDKSFAIAICDITTGDFYTTEFDRDIELLKGEISKYSPSEFLLFKESEIASFLEKEYGKLVSIEDSLIPEDEELILNHEFKEFTGNVSYSSKKAVLGLLNYIRKTQMMSPSNLSVLEGYSIFDTMALDVSTRRNLELTENIVDKSKKGSLLSVLDQTQTSMGARKLRRWVEKPLIKQNEINKRLDAVSSFFDNVNLLEDVRESLKSVYDIERISSKISQKSINARELISLKNSFAQIPVLKELISEINYGEISSIAERIDTLEDLTDLIERSIKDDPSLSVKEGDIIKSGYSKEVDELRDIRTNGKKWIAELEAEERKYTGISSLKIGYNKVFGYFIEVTKANISKLEEGRYIRKQTLSNAERYITDELKVMEEKILGAEEKLQSLEYTLFAEIRDSIEKESDRIKHTANMISDIDCYQSFAKVSLDRNYVRPQFNSEGRVIIKEGRHPVVENMIPRGEFISNDTLLDMKENNFLIITGPNMAGKSTFMRQVALIVLMAQLGCFVPAKEADISVCDRIFTRIGASDDLSGGKSTFMVEMTEVSNILKNATSNSLILLDEVGRGTSTYDGLSIAWSVTEYITERPELRCKTMFATHYHELIELEKKNDHIKNYSVAVKELGQNVIFLRKIIPGGADESYGIEVAKIAGLPKEVIKRAREILKNLEKQQKKQNLISSIESSEKQLSFLDVVDDSKYNELRDKISEIDINSMTPIDALNYLSELKEYIKD